jgi:hypothetical protein
VALPRFTARRRGDLAAPRGPVIAGTSPTFFSEHSLKKMRDQALALLPPPGYFSFSTTGRDSCPRGTPRETASPTPWPRPGADLGAGDAAAVCPDGLGARPPRWRPSAASRRAARTPPLDAAWPSPAGPLARCSRF